MIISMHTIFYFMHFMINLNDIYHFFYLHHFYNYYFFYTFEKKFDHCSDAYRSHYVGNIVILLYSLDNSLEKIYLKNLDVADFFLVAL